MRLERHSNNALNASSEMQSAPPSSELASAPRPSAHRVGWILAALTVGTTLTAMTLRVPRGSGALYAAGFAQAAVWTAASVACRPIAWTGRWKRSREVMVGAIVGALSFVAFVGAAAVGRHIGFLAGPIDSVLSKADAGPVVFVLALAL